jgi:hypothetical protein
MRIVAILLCVVPGRSAEAAGSTHELDESFSSRAVAGRIHFASFLPDGYGRPQRRYPVVYVLHGLPARTRSYRGAAFVAEALQAAKRGP